MKKIVQKIKKIYTPVEITRLLNECFDSKTSGILFTNQDVNNYIQRAQIPSRYGGFVIKIESQNTKKGRLLSINDDGYLEQLRAEKKEEYEQSR